MLVDAQITQLCDYRGPGRHFPAIAPNGGSVYVLLDSLITQRDAGIECGPFGQRRPPTSRRTEPQPAGPVVTFRDLAA